MRHGEKAEFVKVCELSIAVSKLAGKHHIFNFSLYIVKGI